MAVIVKKDGTIYDLVKARIRTKDIIISSPAPRHLTEESEGQQGLIDQGTLLGARNILLQLKLEAADFLDFSLLRDEVFRTFRADEHFYLIEKRNPGKRWKVKVSNPFDIPQRFVYGDIDIELISFSPFSESVGTSIHPRTFTEEVWQVGQGLKAENMKYVHDTTTFEIYNAGDVAVNPRQRQMEMEIKFQGASNNLKIINETTNESWEYGGTSGPNDTISLEGIRSLKNGSSIFGATNKKLISLAPGWNSFRIEGASSSFLISFDTRFYYI